MQILYLIDASWQGHEHQYLPGQTHIHFNKVNDYPFSIFTRKHILGLRKHQLLEDIQFVNFSPVHINI